MTPTNPRPKVIFWYNVYRIVLLIFCLLEAIAGVVIMVYPGLFLGASNLGPISASAFVGGVMLVYSGIEVLLLVISFLLPRSRTAYAYHLVIMGLGAMNGLLGLAAAVPLLIFWVRPEVQAYFGWSTELDGYRPRPIQSPPGPGSSHT